MKTFQLLEFFLFDIPAFETNSNDVSCSRKNCLSSSKKEECILLLLFASSFSIFLSWSLLHYRHPHLRISCGAFVASSSSSPSELPSLSRWYQLPHQILLRKEEVGSASKADILPICYELARNMQLAVTRQFPPTFTDLQHLAELLAATLSPLSYIEEVVIADSGCHRQRRLSIVLYH